MPKFILAAEADQIQDFLFRASRLREVVGGSQLLLRFCEDGTKELLKLKPYRDALDELIISDGGAFRIVFNNESTAQQFGRDLAELYRRCAGGNLTVAAPAVYDNNFQRASRDAQEKLRAAKSRGDASAVATQMPYVAFCASCGVGLAEDHGRRFEDDRANYLCADCANKAAERQERRDSFISAFIKTVRAQLPPHLKRQRLKTPQRGDWNETISQLDPRRYVAYLVADGNGMGKLFDSCTSGAQMRALSKALTRVLRESLAAPCAELLRHQKKVREKKMLPVLPLIIGGDDLFALLPAPWAIDYASRFCLEYEVRMRAMLQGSEINLPKAPLPTIAAAVVICKNTYPHRLAHQRAKEELTRAKDLAKRLEVESTSFVRLSTLNFAVITGNQVGGGVEPMRAGLYRATSRPYFIGDGAPSEWGFSIAQLLAQRDNLDSLPGKRRAELERLFTELPNDKKHPQDAEDLKKRWLPEFLRLKSRIARVAGAEQKLQTVMAALGDATNEKHGYWRRVLRPAETDTDYNTQYGHGIADLLEAWDFSFRLDQLVNHSERE